MTSDASITRYLLAWQTNPSDVGAARQLAELVYRQLRQIAESRLCRESTRPFTPTELVHEAWLNLKPPGKALEGRESFFKLASIVMRNLLVDQARERLAVKRGGDRVRVTLSLAEHEQGFCDQDLVDLDRALDQLAKEHPRHADVVMMRCFAGMKIDEIAAVTGTSRATVKRDWQFARAWLALALKGDKKGRQV